MTPHIIFSDQIARMPKNNENLCRYAIRIKNAGTRNIIDIDIKVLISIKGLFLDMKDIEHEFFLNTTFTSYPILGYKNTDYDNSLLFKLIPQTTMEFSRNIFPQKIRLLKAKGLLSLDDVFDINENVVLQVIVTGYDEYSGARKLFLSPKYYKHNIIDGYFIENTLNITSK